MAWLLSCLTLAAPWTIACWAPLSWEFSRQEYWSRLPFTSPVVSRVWVQVWNPFSNSHDRQWGTWFCEVHLPHRVKKLGSVCDNKATKFSGYKGGERKSGEGTEKTVEVLLSHVRLFATPWTVACQAPQSMGFSRKEYWSGLPFPSPGDLANPGIKSRSPALQAASLPCETPYTSTKCCREESKSKWKSTRRYFKYRGAEQGGWERRGWNKSMWRPCKRQKTHRKMLLSTFVY